MNAPLKAVPVPPVVPLADLDSEGSVLCALLTDEDDGPAYSAVTAPECGLRAEMFFADANRRVFEAIETLRLEGKPTDPVSVCGLMRKRDTLRSAGGSKYVAETLGLCQPATAHPQLFAAEVKHLWQQRKLIETMKRLEILMRHGELSHEGAKCELREHFQGCK